MGSKAKFKASAKTKNKANAAKFNASKSNRRGGGGKAKSNAWRAYTGVSNDPIPF